MRISVSVGEVVDKYSILEIKQSRITDVLKKREIEKELEALIDCKKYIDSNKYVYNMLMNINENIWNLTDIIKSITKTDSSFANISNDIFELNQKRFRLKKFFNNICDSELKEQKSYAETKCNIKISSKDVFYSKITEIYNILIEYDLVSIDCGFEIQELIRETFPPNIISFAVNNVLDSHEIIL